MLDPLRRLAAWENLPIEVAAAFALGGCAAPTTVLNNANPSRAPAADWADYQTLPVYVHGVFRESSGWFSGVKAAEACRREP